MSRFDIPDIRDLVYTLAIIFGGLIVFYGVLWLLVTIGVIPSIVASIFPQIVLIIIGLFIIFMAIERKKKYY